MEAHEALLGALGELKLGEDGQVPAVQRDALLAACGTECSDEDGKQLAAAFAAHRGNPAVIVTLCEAVAELGKIEEARDLLGKHGVLTACVDVLRDAEGPLAPVARLHALRALGNLCVDCEENRKRLLEARGLADVVRVLQSLQEEDLDPGKTASTDRGVSETAAGAGVVLNVASGDDDDVRKALVQAGAVDTLVWLTQHAHGELEKDFALRALTRFANDSDAVDKINDTTAINQLVARFSDPDLDEENRRDTVMLLRALAGSDRVAPEFAKDGLLQRLWDMARNPTLQKTIYGSAATLVSLLLADTTCREILFPSEGGDELLSLLCDWMVAPDEDDLQIAGALAIGNIVRSDELSRRVVAHERVVSSLVQLLRRDFSATQHAALGCIKNLCNLAENRTLFVRHGILEPIAQVLLHTSHAPLQYTAASITRLLCLEQPPEQIAQVAEQLLERLVKLGKSESLPVMAESNRVLVNMVKHGDKDQLIPEIVEVGAVVNFVALLESEHPMLQSEALLALIHITLHSESSARAVWNEAPMPKIVALLSPSRDPALPPQIVGNGVSLVGALLSNPERRSTQPAAAGILALQTLAEGTNPLLRQVAEQVLASFSLPK